MVRFGRRWDVVVAARRGQNVLGGIRSAAETGVLARSHRVPFGCQRLQDFGQRHRRGFPTTLIAKLQFGRFQLIILEYHFEVIFGASLS